MDLGVCGSEAGVEGEEAGAEWHISRSYARYQ